jgi:hypothetical protein
LPATDCFQRGKATRVGFSVVLRRVSTHSTRHLAESDAKQGKKHPVLQAMSMKREMNQAVRLIKPVKTLAHSGSFLPGHRADFFVPVDR